MVKMLTGCRELNLDARNSLGQNAVHIAAINGKLSVLKYLLHKHEERFEQYNF